MSNKIYKCEVTWNDGRENVSTLYFSTISIIEAKNSVMRNLDNICKQDEYVSLLVTEVEKL